MPIKILGNGAIDKKLIVHANAASESAISAIEKAGGSIVIEKKIITEECSICK
jgi:ribosomal protein L15